MSPGRYTAVWLIALAGVLASAALVWLRFDNPLPPLEVAFWYWHQPFRLSASEIEQLKKLGVEQMFVRAGTFRLSGNGARFTMPPEWAGRAEGLKIHLVFNLGYDIVRRFADLSNDILSASLSEAMQREQSRATRAGLHIAGIQLDFDCGTKQLPKYAALLRQIKSKIQNPKSIISITALPTWFTSKDVQKVMNEVDFTVPQYYEAWIPETLNDFATVSSLRMMERGMKAAGRRGRAFYVGIPAYGHSLLYDDHGKLLGTYRDLSVLDAAKHPLFRLKRAFPSDPDGKPATRSSYTGEDILDFVAMAPAPDGRGQGYHLVYDLPTPDLVRQHLNLIRAQRPRNCRGVILFRYPEMDEIMTVPLPALSAALSGKKAAPDLRVRIKTASTPWEIIETGRDADRIPLDLAVTVTNTGTANTFLSPDALTLILYFDKPGLESIEAGDFDSVETFFDDQSEVKNKTLDSALRASLRRANVVRLGKFHLAAGQTARAGPIRIGANGATKVRGLWSMRGTGGFDTVQGVIEPTTLPVEEKR